MGQRPKICHSLSLLLSKKFGLDGYCTFEGKKFSPMELYHRKKESLYKDHISSKKKNLRFPLSLKRREGIKKGQFSIEMHIYGSAFVNVHLQKTKALS